MARYAAIRPDASDQHRAVVWTYDGVMQVGTEAEWQHIAHAGLIEVPESTPGAPVEQVTADHHEHIVEWWHEGPQVYLGVIVTTAVAHTPDGADHALVLGSPQEWAAADHLWAAVKLVRVPAGTPGMSLADHRSLVRPEPVTE